jgi:hypothetical protein
MVGSECLTPIQASQGYPLELLAAKIGRLLICKDWSAAASCTAGPRKRCVKNGALNFEGARRFQQIRGIMAPGRGRWGSFHIHERGKATRSPVVFPSRAVRRGGCRGVARTPDAAPAGSAASA